MKYIDLFLISYQSYFSLYIDITCVSAPDDIDETTFLVSPTVPAGTQLKDLMDTPDYDLGIGLIEAFTKSVTSSDCDEAGDYGLATYEWLSGADFETPVSEMM